MPDSGDVVWVNFPGAVVTKRRPVVVLSSAGYHANRPDVIVGLLTSQIGSASTTTDHVLTDWVSAGLAKPSAFRSYLATLRQSAILAHIGRLSASDWQAVQTCLKRAVDVT